jgi:hypothetical protein
MGQSSIVPGFFAGRPVKTIYIKFQTLDLNCGLPAKGACIDLKIGQNRIQNQGIRGFGRCRLVRVQA